jgi:hypothetical protein
MSGLGCWHVNVEMAARRDPCCVLLALAAGTRVGILEDPIAPTDPLVARDILIRLEITSRQVVYRSPQIRWDIFLFTN